MIPFSYEYPIDKIAKIFEYIMSGKAEDNSKVVIPKIRTYKRENPTSQTRSSSANCNG